ncbi:AraC family transcriptional regulator [Sinomicrobium pectinilyticum]|uniref:AraC family transcriptional regulator n=1 Tax=Sinomicrobium pectinilyticum TaxID=1084421 RepID=A0A3N0EZP8_SINP1|nr:AraC family transcriptional regulator [Sinomicrobium pectinilyticum]
MLIYSDKTISEVAYEPGYTESNHLLRFFKNQTGRPPTEFP